MQVRDELGRAEVRGKGQRESEATSLRGRKAMEEKRRGTEARIFPP